MTETIYQTTAQELKPENEKIVRSLVDIFHDGNFNYFGELLTYTQIFIIYCILFRTYPRIILILPTQYGKSLCVAIGVLLRASTHVEKWAIIAPTEDKARIIMDYIIDHIYDHTWLIKKLDHNGTKEKLKQGRSKTHITFRGAGEVRVYSADARNTQQTKKALMGFGSANIVLDESPQIPDDLYSTIKRMVGGYEGTEGGTFLLEIGNPFFRNHFWRMWNSKRYVRVFVDYITALKEGRYTEDYIEEMKDEAFFDVLYECHFPDESQAPDGYFSLLSLSHIENALIENELPLGHAEGGKLIDKPILGIDPNHGGSNFTVMVLRYPWTGFAKVVLRKSYKDSGNITEDIVADAIKIIDEYDIGDYRTGVDSGGVGAGVADGLERKGYAIEKVMFGQSPENKIRYANAKAELFMRLRKWIIADNGKLVKDDGFLELKEINFKQNISSKVQMESKEELSKRGVASPDVADALALTFITTDNIVEDDGYDVI